MHHGHEKSIMAAGGQKRARVRFETRKEPSASKAAERKRPVRLASQGRKDSGAGFVVSQNIGMISMLSVHVRSDRQAPHSLFSRGKKRYFIALRGGKMLPRLA